MGIKGFFQHLKKKGYSGEPTSPSDLDDVYFDIDLLGTFYWFLIENLARHDQTVKPVDVGKRMAHFLSQTFEPTRTLIHIDGSSTLEKANAHAERKSAKDKVQASIQKNLNKMQQRSNSGKWTSQSVVSQIEKAFAKIYVLTNQVKKELTQGLETVFKVCTCSGESDTCIAAAISIRSTLRIAGKQCQRVAVSSDSDMLIYPAIECTSTSSP